MIVVLSPRAEDQIVELYNYIADQASADIARQYTQALQAYCASLATFPNRGIQRGDLRSGLRMTHYRGRTMIAFVVGSERVEILGIFHGGQDYSARL